MMTLEDELKALEEIESILTDKPVNLHELVKVALSEPPDEETLFRHMAIPKDRKVIEMIHKFFDGNEC